jgi:tRNA(Ile)-lysidine synthase
MREFDGDSPDFDLAIADPVIRSLTAARAALGLGSEVSLRVVVAVSGGEDSVVLLDLLDSIRRTARVPLELMVCHFDHRLRPESGEEANFVRRLAADFNLPFRTGAAELHRPPGNVEAWAREVRYEFLEAVRSEHGYDLVATAHHRLDQTETFLFRTVTGRLASGAQGIRSLDLRRRLIRPLLLVEKTSIEEYGLRCRLSFVFDSSNADITRTRNRIRHQVIPILSRINPGLISSIGSIAERLEQDDLFLEQIAEEALVKAGGDASVAWLSELPTVLQWRVLRLISQQQLGARGREIGYDAFSRVVRSIGRAGSRYSVFELGRGVKCRVDRRGWFSFFIWGEDGGSAEQERLVQLQSTPAENQEPPILFPSEGVGDRPTSAQLQTYSYDLTVPGDVVVSLEDQSKAKVTSRIFNSDEIRLTSLLEQIKTERGSYLDQDSAIFDYSIVQQSLLTVRSRLPGDRMVIWGRGTRKIKKVFQEQQVKLTLRDSLPIVCINGIVLWIPGVARSQFAPVTENTTLVLQVIYSRMLGV